MIRFWLLISVLVLGIGSVSSGGELVTNGGFESNSFSHWTGTATTDTGNGVVGKMSGIDPYELTHQASFLNMDPETISQALSTTINDSETISFALADYAGINTDSFKVYFGGALLATISNPGSGYKTYSYNATATSASTTLSFTMTNPQGTWLLDAVSVTQSSAPVTVPEPSTFALTCVACVSGLGHALFRRRKGNLAV